MLDGIQAPSTVLVSIPADYAGRCHELANRWRSNLGEVAIGVVASGVGALERGTPPPARTTVEPEQVLVYLPHVLHWRTGRISKRLALDFDEVLRAALAIGLQNMDRLPWQ
jgi:hypothetical protein